MSCNIVDSCAIQLASVILCMMAVDKVMIRKCELYMNCSLEVQDFIVITFKRKITVD